MYIAQNLLNNAGKQNLHVQVKMHHSIALSVIQVPFSKVCLLQSVEVDPQLDWLVSCMSLDDFMCNAGKQSWML